jgi:F0F1-type ATP synthase assembly protein I
MKSDKNISYIDKHGIVRHSSVKKGNKENKEVDYTKYLNLGFYLAAPLLLGVFIGLKLDDVFHTKPVFTISLIVLGAVATFYNLIRITKENA